MYILKKKRGKIQLINYDILDIEILSVNYKCMRRKISKGSTKSELKSQKQ